MVVGASGFEPPTSWSRTRRSSQAEPRPADTAGTAAFLSIASRLLFGVRLNGDQNVFRQIRTQTNRIRAPGQLNRERAGRVPVRDG